MKILLVLTPLFVSLLAVLFAAIKAYKVMKLPEGDDRMKKIALAIRKGANAFLKKQYVCVLAFFVIVFVIMLFLAGFKKLQVEIPFAFISGGVFSALAGFVGMKIATAANSRTAFAAMESLNKGLKTAFSSGSVMGFTVVGFGLFFISAWVLILNAIGMSVSEIASTVLTFGMGASSMALFARVGGGIFTKAADVGADLVGKVEVGIPEDDPRNPAVIADNVGDNVGDVAGMGADLFESYVGALVSASALAMTAGIKIGGIESGGFFLPLMLAALGIVASMIGTFFVKTKEDTSQSSLLLALRRGVWLAAAITAAGAYPLCRFFIGRENIGCYFAILAGLVAGVLIGYFTEYYTSDTYKPTQKLAATSKTGSATIIIGGISLGMLSTAIPVVIVGVAVICSFVLAGSLYGVALAAVGMLSTLGITLATDAYGPIADNAGGIAQMAGLDEVVRERTDALDSLGNTTAATGKGFAIGSAALTALALVASFIEEVKLKGGSDFELNLSIIEPKVLVGIFIGAMLPFVFSALTMNSVGKAAQSVVVEVRRQFREIAGIMEGTADPDYEKCVALCTRSSLREMVIPAVIAIMAPLIVGFFVGVNGVAGMLVGATASGFILAIMLSNSGGAWDNAKKYIEGGNLGGKGSEQHKAAVVGDTVGDPFKDTSGPAINILIKLLSTSAIVFLSLIMTVTLNY